MADVACELLRDWIYAFFDVTYCDALDLSSPAVQSDPVHTTDTEQAAKSSPLFEQLAEKYVREQLPKYLSALEDMIARGGSGWLAGGAQHTYADIIGAEYVDQHIIFRPSLFSDGRFPLVKQLYERVLLLDGIRQYRASSRFKAEPLHNRYSHFHKGWVSG